MMMERETVVGGRRTGAESHRVHELGWCNGRENIGDENRTAGSEARYIGGRIKVRKKEGGAEGAGSPATF